MKKEKIVKKFLLIKPKFKKIKKLFNLKKHYFNVYY